jgi:hypothetical protein
MTALVEEYKARLFQEKSGQIICNTYEIMLIL